jgi:hypothetical protein
MPAIGQCVQINYNCMDSGIMASDSGPNQTLEEQST